MTEPERNALKVTMEVVAFLLDEIKERTSISYRPLHVKMDRLEMALTDARTELEKEEENK